MIFGNKADFAIESMVEPDLEPPSSVWGRLRIWISGVSIGDYDDSHCGLWNCYINFQKMSDDLNDLWLETFESCDELEIWNYLDAALYGYHGNIELDDCRTPEQVHSDAERYFKFDFLTNWGEMFDRGGKSFLLKLPNGYLKVLNYDHINEKINSYQCSELGFRQAVKGFIIWFKEQEGRLKNA